MRLNTRFLSRVEDNIENAFEVDQEFIEQQFRTDDIGNYLLCATVELLVFKLVSVLVSVLVFLRAALCLRL